MQPNVEELTRSVAEDVCGEMNSAVDKIKHCLNQLDDGQVWWRPADEMNTIGNLILHLCGNVRQWIVSGVGGADDVRDRPREFSERGPIPKQELIGRLEETVGEARDVIHRIAPAELLRRRRIQQFDVSGAGAMFHAMAHFRGHTQEIVHMTRCQLGARYQFSFVPTSEQGA